MPGVSVSPSFSFPVLLGCFLCNASSAYSAFLQLRYREKLIFPPGTNAAAGSVRVGAPLRTAVRSPKDFAKLSHAFRGERFLLNVGDGRSDLILHRDATGEDVLK
jgi:hypothetical protein